MRMRASPEELSCLSNVSAQRHTFRSLNKSNSIPRSRFPFVAMSQLPDSIAATTTIIASSEIVPCFLCIHWRRQVLKALIKKNSIHENRMRRIKGEVRQTEEKQVRWKGDLPAQVVLRERAAGYAHDGHKDPRGYLGVDSNDGARGALRQISLPIALRRWI